MMRVPTITTLLSLVTLFTLNPTRAIASNEIESLTTEKKRDLTSQSNSKILTFGKKHTSNIKPWKEQRNQNSPIPFLPKNFRLFEKKTQSELFSKPFYSGIPQKQNNQKNISQGARGAEVWAVQRRLQARGFDPGAVDSVFGSRTKAAVLDFQKSIGLTATGIVDGATWTALAQPSLVASSPVHRKKPSIPKPNLPVQMQKILTKGDKGSKVKTLQIRLETMGFNPGPIDGVYGVKTATAVKEFQKYRGIKASGIVDQKTWKAFSKKSQ